METKVSGKTITIVITQDDLKHLSKTELQIFNTLLGKMQDYQGDE